MNKALIFFILITVTGNVHAQQKQIDSLLKILPHAAQGKPRIDVLNKIAYSYTLISVEEAEKIVKQSLQESRDSRYDDGLAKAYRLLGSICYIRGEYNLAAEYDYTALKLYEKLEDPWGCSGLLNSLAMIFAEQREYDKVYELSMKSIAMKRSIGDSLGVATSRLALAGFFLNRRESDEAMEHCRKALAQYRTLQNEWGISRALLQIGEVYHAEQNHALAFTHYTEALQYAKLSSDYFQQITLFKKLGQLYLETGRFDSSYYYLHKAKQLAHLKNNRNNEMQADQFLANYFVRSGALDSALYYTQQAMEIEREIFNHQKAEQIATLQMQYNNEKKDQELSFQKKIVRRQYAAIIGVSLILILSIIFGFKLYRLNKNNAQANNELLKLNREINAMNENLESLVQERTEEIKIQNQKLIEYTFFTAHEIRGPVARILGLIELAKLQDLSDEDKGQIMVRMEEASTELDDVIRTINRKLERENRS